MSEKMNLNPGVMIVLVNWNRYSDTLACLESLRKLEYANYFVVVCDNGSQDGSAGHFRDWAEANNVAYRQFSNEEVATIPAESPRCGSLTCIAGAVNRGFAGGNNWALKYALRLNTVQYVWLLNNDTVVEAAALAELVKVSGQNPAVGMCGSTVLRMDRPNIVQCLGGGRYNFWTGWTRHIGEGAEWDPNADKEALRVQVEAKLDFVYGASLFISYVFLREVGLMSEDYFLYFEELDWAERARGRYVMGYAPGSVLWHKEGASILLADRKKSETADFYMIRNRVLFTLRYCRKALLSVFAGILVSAGKRLWRGQPGRIVLLGRAVVDGVKAAGK